jgi:Cu(I)/Ag(I) efflux system protein CusF
MNIRFFSHMILALALALPLIPQMAGAASSLPGPAGSSRYLADNDHGAHGSHSQGAKDASSETVYTATGIVEAVNEPQGKMTITHDPVPALNWPKMTMRFTPETPALMEGLKKGDKVRLDFRNRNGVSIILHIEVIS